MFVFNKSQILSGYFILRKNILAIFWTSFKLILAEAQIEDADGDYDETEEVETGDDPEFISTGKQMKVLLGEDVVFITQSFHWNR